ncbi:HU family DNA-binding protein [Alkalimonas mucilaginosa]|uniref:HU family DNA-binding protein n=1 Tax=Alkalimonas mucilaginosa TaxID=3057676 RepID=A0ABU7JHV7_9GAMM|nr:HU family DNA-binding protein [Alkalimonas sp. MEB004]MEE2025055.1 HU family DNA-binding protein [Alkalimonas sp. MEB004]
MNKSQLIQQLATDAGLTKAGAERAVDSLLSIITQQLQSNHTVSIQGFGSFIPRQAAARTGKHPVSGLPTHQPACVKAVFKQSPQLKDALNP